MDHCIVIAVDFESRFKIVFRLIYWSQQFLSLFSIFSASIFSILSIFSASNFTQNLKDYANVRFTANIPSNERNSPRMPLFLLSIMYLYLPISCECVASFSLTNWEVRNVLIHRSLFPYSKRQCPTLLL